MPVIKDTIFSINTEKKTENTIRFDFVYNQYEESETISKDDEIVNNTVLFDRKKRFVRISHVENSFQYPDATYYTDENYCESIFALSQVNSLNKTQTRIFNKIDKLCPERKSFINNLDLNETNRIIDYYLKGQNLSVTRKSYLKRDLSSSQRISIRDNFDSNLIDEFTNTNFPEPDVADQMLNYDLLIYENKKSIDEILSIVNNGELFPELNILEQTINDVDYDQYSKANAIKCGYLVEKFILKNNGYEFLCSRFFTKDKNEKDLSNLPVNIEDEAVRYGETYRYMVSDVYLYMIPEPKNRFILNKYLICDFPYISKDITCKEYIPPSPPNDLKFYYHKDKKKLQITWVKPNDHQNDVKGYQILRRFDLKSPFEVIAQLEGHSEIDLYLPEETVPDNLIIKTPEIVDTMYYDKSYDPGKITIYSIRAIDAHGMFSNYSDQIAILYDFFEEKIIYDTISEKGAKRNTPNIFVKQNSLFFENDVDIIDNLPVLKNVSKISLYVSPDFVQIKNDEEIIKILDEKYQFTLFRINDLAQYKKSFEIKNFILEE